MQKRELMTDRSVKNDRVEYHAIGNVDSTTDPTDPKRVFGKFVWEGSMYVHAAINQGSAPVNYADSFPGIM